jgi:histidine triad (HIT) family protein
MAEENCTFCNIAAKTLHANILHESENVLVVQDIMPQAPVHAQIISKRHIPTMNDLTEADASLISEMILAAKNFAQESGVAEAGYKLVWNNGKQGGMIIPHLHIHFLAGKQLPEL